MANSIFRKKSMERVSSPEQLNDYIRVTSPGIWLVLAAVIALLIGFVVWAVVGKLESKVSAAAVSSEGTVVCYVRDSEIANVAEGKTVRINGNEYSVASVSVEPIAVDESFTPYTLRIGGLTVGEWVYVVTVNGDLAAGVYEASIVTDSISPISFLFN